jgi:hypothetical protein
MKTRLFKQLPSGNSDFRDIILNGYAYIDKTRFIEELEKESNRNHFFIRPRKFGKSTFLAMLRNYYDINTQDEFDQIFGNLYIGKHPTQERNSYAIMKFDFSGLNTASEESFRKDFSKAIQDAVCKFLRSYKYIIPEAGDKLSQIDKKEPEVNVVSTAFDLAYDSKIKIYVIIDEYDYFANDLIAMGTLAGEDFYKTMVTARYGARFLRTSQNGN